jgi:hypothetical protein
MAILAKFKDKLLEFHTRLGLEKRTISRKDNKKYLTRYYLYRKPFAWMPSLYLHCFHSSDEDLDLHSHPWGQSISLILSGSYKEELFDKNNNVYSRVLKPGMFNLIQANKFHRIDLLDKEVWTLFLSGSKTQSWGFKNRESLEYIDWKEHEKRKTIKSNVYSFSQKLALDFLKKQNKENNA